METKIRYWIFVVYLLMEKSIKDYTDLLWSNIFSAFQGSCDVKKFLEMCNKNCYSSIEYEFIIYFLNAVCFCRKKEV